MKEPLLEQLNDSNCTERSMWIHYPEFAKFITSKYPFILKWTERLYWYYHDLKEYPKCPVCGKPVKFQSLGRGYREFCSLRCAGNDEKTKQKVKQTCLERYGVENAFQSEEIQSKFKQTCLEKYGVENPFQSEKIKERIKKVNKENLGVDYPMQSKKVRNKSKKTCLDKYGVPYTGQMYMGKNLYERFPFIKNVLDGGMWECYCQNPKCNKCQEKTFIDRAAIIKSRYELGAEICTKRKPIGFNQISGLEEWVTNILDKYNIKYESHNRKLISPQELDIYIPSKNLAIECNGIFWHDSNHKDENYHFNKSQICKAHGIRLIHIWEDWIRNKPDIVESLLLSKIGIKHGLITVYARQTQIELCENKKEYLQFMDRNHIQGRSGFQEAYGLRYNGELISIMTFGHKRGCVGNYKKPSDENEWELLRFCSKLGYHIPGAASKLLKHFIKDFGPQLIYSYASNDISEGNVYEKLGFVSTGKINQSYWYIDIETGKRYHRSAFTKNSIVKRGWKDVNDSSWTEREVMEQMGYIRLNDAGQTRWDLEIKNFHKTR